MVKDVTLGRHKGSLRKMRDKVWISSVLDCLLGEKLKALEKLMQLLKNSFIGTLLFHQVDLIAHTSMLSFSISCPLETLYALCVFRFCPLFDWHF